MAGTEPPSHSVRAIPRPRSVSLLSLKIQLFLCQERSSKASPKERTVWSLFTSGQTGGDSIKRRLLCCIAGNRNGGWLPIGYKGAVLMIADTPTEGGLPSEPALAGMPSRPNCDRQAA